MISLSIHTDFHGRPFIVMGRSTLDEFQKYNRWDTMNPKIVRLRLKLHEIEGILYTDIPLAESPDTNSLSFANESESERLYRVKIIEDSFKEELTFLFYLNLNNIAFSANLGQWFSTKEQEFKEMSDLGSPINRLMAILTKDNDIKQWFTERIGDIMHYRNETLKKMYKFYNEILDSQQYTKKEQNEEEIHSWELGINKELDINKICSY